MSVSPPDLGSCLVQSCRGVPRPAAVPARVRLHRGNALVAGRSRALTPSQPLGRRFRYSPRAAPRCRAPRPGACRTSAPRGRSLHQGGALRLLAPVSSASGACPAPGSVCKISLPFFPCRQALVSTRLNFSSSRTRIASSPFSACSLILSAVP